MKEKLSNAKILSMEIINSVADLWHHFETFSLGKVDSQYLEDRLKSFDSKFAQWEVLMDAEMIEALEIASPEPFNGYDSISYDYIHERRSKILGAIVATFSEEFISSLNLPLGTKSSAVWLWETMPADRLAASKQIAKNLKSAWDPDEKPKRVNLEFNAAIRAMSSTPTVLEASKSKKKSAGEFESAHLIPRDISEQLGVGVESVLKWIHNGELRASNVSNSDTRPRWKIAKTDLDSFLDARGNQPEKAPTPPSKRPKPKSKRKHM